MKSQSLLLSVSLSLSLYVVLAQSPSSVQFFETPWTAACQAYLPLTISHGLPKFMSIESVMDFLFTCILLFCFPAGSDGEESAWNVGDPGRPWRSIMSFSSTWKWKVKVKSLSHVQLPVTSWTAAHQAPLSMGFSRQEYWSGVPSQLHCHIPNPRFWGPTPPCYNCALLFPYLTCCSQSDL